MSIGSGTIPLSRGVLFLKIWIEFVERDHRSKTANNTGAEGRRRERRPDQMRQLAEFWLADELEFVPNMDASRALQQPFSIYGLAGAARTLTSPIRSACERPLKPGTGLRTHPCL
jgi:hypothetical protein